MEWGEAVGRHCSWLADLDKPYSMEATLEEISLICYRTGSDFFMY